ncbi:MAG: hypothetical protein EOO88_57110 [Pedobacter sp.]|nr:MAG: hypothetical protein EOO88_57110 [Pedobacter sp.]
MSLVKSDLKTTKVITDRNDEGLRRYLQDISRYKPVSAAEEVETAPVAEAPVAEEVAVKITGTSLQLLTNRK